MRVVLPEFRFDGHDAFSALRKIVNEDDPQLERVLFAYLRSLDDDQLIVARNRIIRRYFADDARLIGLTCNDAMKAIVFFLYHFPESDVNSETFGSVRPDSEQRPRPTIGEVWMENACGVELRVTEVCMMETEEGTGSFGVMTIRARDGGFPRVFDLNYFMGEVHYGDGVWRPRFHKMVSAYR